MALTTTQIRGSTQIKAASITAAELNASIAGYGISGGAGTAFAIELSELTAAVLDVAADSIPFLDATDASTKIESVADFIAAIAGNGLTPTAGVLAVNTGAGVTISGDAVLIDVASTVTFSGATWTFPAGELLVTGTPSTSNSVPNKSYVDSSLNGLKWKSPPIGATTPTDGNQSLTVFVGTGGYIDTYVPIVDGETYLIKDNTDLAENGLYTAGAATGGSAATQSITFTGTGSAGNTITLTRGTYVETFTFRVTATDDFDVTIGGTAADTATNFITAITNYSRIVTAATGGSAIVDMTAKALGTGSIASADPDGIVTGEGTFTAGTNPTARALTRSTEMDEASEFSAAAVFVREGTLNGDTGWTQRNEVTVVGTSDVVFGLFHGGIVFSTLTGDSGTATVSSGNLNILDATNGGIATTGSGSTISIALDLNDLSAAAVDVSADSIAILDATDGSTKLESIADLATAMAGTGLTATGGVISLAEGETVVPSDFLQHEVEGDGVTTAFDFSSTGTAANVNTIHVFVNGSKVSNTTGVTRDLSALTTTVATFNSPPSSEDTIIIAFVTV